MISNTPLQCLDWWMEAGLYGGDWRTPLDRTAEVLGAKATVLICSDVVTNAATVSVSSEAPIDFVLHCRALAGERLVQPRQYRVDGFGFIVAASAVAGAVGRRQCVTILALQGVRTDPASLQAVATVAAAGVSAKARIQAVQAASALKTAALDQLPFGVAIVDGHLRAAEINESCRGMIERSDGSSILQERLFCSDRGDQAALAAAVSAALKGDGEAPIVRIHRSRGAEPYVVRAVCAGGSARVDRKCLLMIIDPAGAPPLANELWRAMFDLTDCELAIAEGIVAGRKIIDIASQRGVSVETVRTQTKRMFERLNVSSQVEAAGRLARAAPFRQPTVSAAGQ